MKLIINGRFLTQHPGGVQNFAAGVVNALQKKGIAFELVAPNIKGFQAPEHVTIIGPGNVFLWEQHFLPRYVKKQKNAILLNLCNSAPLSLKQQIVTIHDLAFEQKNNNWFKPAFRKWYKLLIPRICRNSKMIFTVSGFSKNELIRYYSIPSTKIHIIPNGLPDLPTDAEVAMRNSYFLMTGINNPRKNALEVLGYIDLIVKKRCKLIVVKNDSEVFGTIDFPKHPAIVYLKNIPAGEYFNLLKNAKALIYPSLYEGFGIPVLESLCLQTPVIASDLDVFKEAFADLPVYFQPGDPNSFQQALDAVEQKEISKAAIEKLKNNYNFENSVSLILEQLETLR